MSTLIVYYSRKGENYWNGSIKNLKEGNTEIVAEFIQKAVGGDLFEVETAKRMPTIIISALTKHRKNRVKTHAPNSKRRLTWISMILYLLATLIAGELCPWRCLLCLKVVT